ncbi:DUF2267 domain-containing protein [Salinisphaera sp.]|uniref:DUF2267 domain-containing protein n=1 Tax=Salinisphaera sp. TaxID=1914330 RepID=UPI0025F6B18C|nr:DUF2267 domain-containing protein [Salinisphaera sp.]
MPQHGLATIDTTVQQTNRWLGAIMTEMGTDDKQFAFQALRSVLTTLRDRLPVDVAANLGAQLPMLVRGLYYDGYVPADTPTKYRRASEWNAAVAAAGDNLEGEDVERASRAVLSVLEFELDSGLVTKVAQELPDEVRSVVSL